jgi:hypothetical protein
MPRKEERVARGPGRRYLPSTEKIQSELLKRIEPLERLTESEARWLHRHRTLDFVHALIVAKNEVQMNPLMGDRRIGWNTAVREWRASETYPFKKGEK